MYSIGECFMDEQVTVVTEKANEIQRKQHFTGKVLKTSLAGAKIDIGAEQPAVLHISQMEFADKNKSNNRVEDILEIGQEIDVWVKRIKDDHIELTMAEPLALEWREIKSGMNVTGKVSRLENFGAFVEIGAERPGLVHVSEITHGYIKSPSEVLKEGEEVEAQILEVNRRKKQIKLSMKVLQPEPEELISSKPSSKFEGKRGKKGKKKSGKDYKAILAEEESQAEPEPTAMEIALRAAMDRAKKKEDLDLNKPKKEKSSANVQDDILSRTLNNKVKTN